MANSACIYGFGPFQLDTGAHRLLKENTPVSLAPKTFDLLQVLIEHHGRAMSKSELLKALWPDTDVEEGNLAFQVSILRKALGPEASSSIETVPRHGYRFSAPVVVHSAADIPAPSSAVDVAPQGGPKRYVTAAAIALVVVASGILIATHERTDAALSEISTTRNRALASRAVPLTAFHGMETDPAISPDGKYVAFAWDGEKQDNFDIYVVEIESGTLDRITTDPAHDMSPAWSPDGGRIAFLRRVGDDQAALMVVRSTGGVAHRVAETRNGALQRPENSSSLGWSPDGRWVAASHREGQELHESLHLFSMTGEKRQLTVPPQDSFGDHMPTFSPDGRKLAFCRLLGFATSEVYLLSLDENLRPQSEVRRLTNNKGWSVNPAWAHGNSEVLYVVGPSSSSRTGREVRIASAAGEGVSERTLPISDELWQITAGKHLVYSTRRQDVNIWRAKIPGRQEQPGLPELFISSTAADYGARYSPDGSRISFVSSRSGSVALWISNADGSGKVQMTSFGGPLIGPPAWSPDGHSLVFHARPQGQADLFAMPDTGGAPKRLTDHPSDDNVPTYSRDGRSVYFSSVRTGRLQVFRMPMAGGDAVPITTGGGKRPIQSLDGKSLFYVSENGGAIRQVGITGGSETDVVTSVCPEFGFALTIEGVIYPARSGDSCEFRLLTLATGKSRLLARTAARPLGRTVSISPDGKYFLFDQAERPGMDLMVIENFQLP